MQGDNGSDENVSLTIANALSGSEIPRLEENQEIRRLREYIRLHEERSLGHETEQDADKQVLSTDGSRDRSEIEYHN